MSVILISQNIKKNDTQQNNKAKRIENPLLE